jgi:hypothetical protein
MATFCLFLLLVCSQGPPKQKLSLSGQKRLHQITILVAVRIGSESDFVMSFLSKNTKELYKEMKNIVFIKSA